MSEGDFDDETGLWNIPPSWNWQVACMHEGGIDALRGLAEGELERQSR
jgi:hypothetical protein